MRFKTIFDQMTKHDILQVIKTLKENLVSLKEYESATHLRSAEKELSNALDNDDLKKLDELLQMHLLPIHTQLAEIQNGLVRILKGQYPAGYITISSVDMPPPPAEQPDLQKRS